MKGGEESGGEVACGGFDEVAAVGEAHVGVDGVEGGVGVVGEPCGEDGDVGEAADVDILGGAVVGLAALGVTGEEVAVALLDVGVAVAAGGGHEGDVAVEVVGGVVGLARVERGEEFQTELHVEGVVAGAKELVVVDAGLAPVDGLVVEDLALGVGGRVG